MSNVDDPGSLKDFIGSTLTKIIREVNKARIIQNYRIKCPAQRVDHAAVPPNSSLENLHLKWSEHRAWIQLKTDLSRGTAPIKYFAENWDKSSKKCKIYICDMSDKWYGQV